MKIVIDTNVFVSSFLNPKGTPRLIIDLWKSGQVTLCLCAEILSEYLEVLSRFGLAGEPELRELLDLFKTRQGIEFVVIDNDQHIIEADPVDNKFLECALITRAACIVSGDKHLNGLQENQGVSIISPSEFMTRHGSR
ncbi:MAG: putative toxin-antitoxin system toxin component, PIN family [Geobacteraceae bacterium]